MDLSSMLDTNSLLESSVQGCRVPQLPRADLLETFTKLEGDYLVARSTAAVCRTVLLSENGLFRAGLKQMLQVSRISVIGEGHDIASLLDTMKMQPIPELVICHIASDRNAKAALKLIDGIRLHFIPTRLVILADTCSRSVLADFVSADANAVLITRISDEILMQSLELVLLDYRLFPSEVLSLITDAPVQLPLGWMPTESFGMLSGNATPNDTNKTQAGIPTAPPSSAQLTTLISQRERQVLGCLVRGLSNKCIARELNIVEGTVKVYLKRLSRKLNARNRTQLAIWAVHQLAQLDTVMTTEREDGDPDDGRGPVGSSSARPGLALPSSTSALP
jgi:two-component system nitrate/nitrite response regulator NarL